MNNSVVISAQDLYANRDTPNDLPKARLRSKTLLVIVTTPRTAAFPLSDGNGWPTRSAMGLARVW
jgi:hypothetical protein